jgi:threonine synthase
MLRCGDCGREYADRWRCACGHALDFADPPLPDTGTPSVDPGEGLWAFPFLAVSRRVSLGEGFTPLVEAPGWDAAFKLDYLFPTGSFKDRGAATTLSRAAALGVDRVLEDSSGNAGAAIATYAARAGIDCRVFVPASVKKGKLRALRRVGADVERVEGDREAVTAACHDAVESGEGWYASHAWNPAFFEGTATMAYEIAWARDWSVPDAVVLPVGHGTMLLGAYRGFRRLRAAGWTDRMPRLLGVQAAGYDPIARAFDRQRGDDSDPDGRERNDLADGIRIREPARRDQLVAAIRDSGGDCIAVGEAALERELSALGGAGFDTEPTCAVAPAGLRAYRERGALAPDADVVVPLSGSGLKT